jgi:hypothetical protein
MTKTDTLTQLLAELGTPDAHLLEFHGQFIFPDQNSNKSRFWITSRRLVRFPEYPEKTFAKGYELTPSEAFEETLRKAFADFKPLIATALSS